jgi:hypothetical protein
MIKYIVNIKQIDWLDRENPEAEILFEICGKEFWAFCHPCNFKEDEIVEVFFSFIEEEMSEYAFWEENKERNKEIVPSNKNRFHYYCYGELKSIHPVVIDCGTLNLSFGDWINDERMLGNYVYFVIARLDIFRVI